MGEGVNLIKPDPEPEKNFHVIYGQNTFPLQMWLHVKGNKHPFLSTDTRFIGIIKYYYHNKNNQSNTIFFYFLC